LLSFYNTKQKDRHQNNQLFYVLTFLYMEMKIVIREIRNNLPFALPFRIAVCAREWGGGNKTRLQGHKGLVRHGQLLRLQSGAKTGRTEGTTSKPKQGFFGKFCQLWSADPDAHFPWLAKWAMGMHADGYNQHVC
jgi:hypothetical protein